MQKSYQSVLAAFATQRTVNDELRWRYIKGAEECWSAEWKTGAKGSCLTYMKKSGFSKMTPEIIKSWRFKSFLRHQLDFIF